MTTMITGGCNCGRHTYTIPKPTEMNLCRKFMPITFYNTSTDLQIQIASTAGNGPAQCMSPSQQSLNHSRISYHRRRHSAHMFVKTADIQTSSPQPRIYAMKADSGKPMERAWCDECGCGIWIRSPEKRPDMTMLKAGTQLLAVVCLHMLSFHSTAMMYTDDPIRAGGAADCRTTGLFNPGEIPNPTMENWLKNMESWETPAKGTERTAQLN